MKKALAAAAFLFLALPTLAAKIEKKSITVAGKERTYYLLVPESVTKEHPAPMIVMLHGSGRRGNILLEHWQSLAEKEGIILAGPDSWETQGWDPQLDSQTMLRDIVDEVKSKFPVDDRRVYLFGHSAGARYALQLGLIESEYFAAVAVHAGDLEDSSLLSYATRKMPFAIVVGTTDPYFPLINVRKTRDLLKDGGFTVELTEIPHHDHDYYRMSKSINDTVWSFLKKYALEKPQKFTVYSGM